MTLPPAAPPPPQARPGVWRMCARGVARRCPNCGATGVWRTWFRMLPECPVCLLPLDRGESDHFYGAYMLNFVVAELVPVLVFVVTLLATWPDPPWNLLTAVMVALGILSPIFFYPITKGLWLAIDLAMRPVRD